MQKITTHDVCGVCINVWHPTDTNTNYNISMTEGGWLAGSYDSVDSALMGAQLNLNNSERFYILQKKINHSGRLITADNLKPLLTPLSK